MLPTHRIFLSVFLTGFCVMVLEIVGARIIAPYFGTSLYIWTTLIGSILSFLTIGYYLGGKLSLKSPSIYKLSLFILFSGIWILALVISKNLLLDVISQKNYLISLQIFISIILLFAVPSILLGLVSPYSAKLVIHNLTESGLSVGKLYALSTIGSILGTFITGFLLIPYIGVTRILFLIAFLLILNSLILSTRQLILKITLLVLILIGSLTGWSLVNINSNLVYETDTNYSHVRLFDNKTSHGTERLMYIDEANSSGVILEDKNQMVFDYYHFYNLMFWHKKNLENTLLIGGAGMGYPRYIQEKHPNLKMTVVEIDPKLYEISKKYLDYQDSQNISMNFQDGRLFLNQNDTQFDAILFDVFSGYTIPWHLMTLEATEKVKLSLSSQGLVIINIVGSTTGNKSLVADSIISTYKQVFPYIEVFSVLNPPSKENLQNIILVASNQKLDFENNFLDNDTRKLLSNRIYFSTSNKTLTDNFAPIDYYSFKLSE